MYFSLMTNNVPLRTEDFPEIPLQLSKYTKEIKATTKDSIRIELTPSTSLNLWQSKVGGCLIYQKLKNILAVKEENLCIFLHR